jgi:hypothetical protein
MPTTVTYLGIDNGTSGAIALLTPSGAVLCEPVLVQDLGKEKLLDIAGNLELLQQMIGGAAQVLVVFEQAQITPQFGYKNNYTNGRNNEFWRVLLTLARIPFTWVNPQRWQREMFSGIRGDDTKEMADLVRRQRFPGLDLSRHTKIEISGINDAICIALWARQLRR